VTNGASCHPGAAVENQRGENKFSGTSEPSCFPADEERKSRANQPGFLLFGSRLCVRGPTVGCQLSALSSQCGRYGVSL